MSGSKEPDKAEDLTKASTTEVTRITPHEAVADDHEGDLQDASKGTDPAQSARGARKSAPTTRQLASGTTVSSAISPAVPPTEAPQKSAPDPAADPSPSQTGQTAAPKTSDQPATKPTKRGGFWPLVLGGVVAAGIGAGAAWWVIPQLPPAWQPDLPSGADGVDQQTLKDEILAELAAGHETSVEDDDALQDRVAGILAGYRAEIDELVRATAADEVQDQIKALEGDADATPEELALAVTEQGQRLDQLEADLAKLTASDTAPAEPAGGPAAGASTTPIDEGADAQTLATLREELETLSAGLAALEARPEADPEAIASLDQKLDHEISDLGQSIGDISSRMDAVESRLTGLDAVAQLSAALRSGDAVGREAASAALAEAGMTEAAELARNAPTLKELQDRYDDAARRALAATRKAGKDGDLGTGLADFFSRRTNARAVTPREGNDPDAIQARAGAKLADGDVAAALAELEAMPEPARDAMDDWLADAETWVATEAAIEQITQPAKSGD